MFTKKSLQGFPQQVFFILPTFDKMSKNKRETEAYDCVHYMKTKVSYLQCAIIYQTFVK